MNFEFRPLPPNTPEMNPDDGGILEHRDTINANESNDEPRADSADAFTTTNTEGPAGQQVGKGGERRKHKMMSMSKKIKSILSAASVITFPLANTSCEDNKIEKHTRYHTDHQTEHQTEHQQDGQSLKSKRGMTGEDTEGMEGENGDIYSVYPTNSDSEDKGNKPQHEIKPETKPVKPKNENEGESKNIPETTLEAKEALAKLGIERNQIKEAYLEKLLEGKYGGSVIVDLSEQRLTLFDKNYTKIINGAHISSGEEGMETPIGSYESGFTNADYRNNQGDDMPLAVNVDPKRGIFLHQGALPGVPASHGCIREDRKTAEIVYEYGSKSKGNLLIIIKP